MDLVNQNMNIRKELIEAYIQNKYFINKTTEVQNYLIDEPSGNVIDLINENNNSKWPISFIA